jgi:hypothetical protein
MKRPAARNTASAHKPLVARLLPYEIWQTEPAVEQCSLHVRGESQDTRMGSVGVFSRAALFKARGGTARPY